MYEWIKESIEFLAFLGAALFFGFKLLSGFFIHNLSVSLKYERSAVKNTDNDILIVTAELEKGDISAITLHDIQARISYNQHSVSIPFQGIHRCSYTTQNIGSACRKVAKIERQSQSSPLLNLSLGEKASFSCSLEVPAKEIVTVELVVLGKRAYIGTWVGQWRSSVIATPLVQR
ncbi:MAG: hypothetical protein BMS9Abin36_1557 [Gammaproteobacteria bacterium]|nr:MAG: hypothetical protein BMS9Abin36_1557 [Gammaproteobacteria bacterium]